MRRRMCHCHDCLSGIGLNCQKQPWLGEFDMWKKVMRNKTTNLRIVNNKLNSVISSSAKKNREVKALMKEVKSQISTVFPDFWAEGAVAADADVDS